MSAEGYILLVEHNPDDAASLRPLLKAQVGQTISGVRISAFRCLQTLDAAIRVLDSEPGCIGFLLDLDRPGSQRLEALSAIQAHAPDVPVIVVMGEGNADAGLAAVVAGAQDYLPKQGLDGRLLTRALQYAAQRKGLESALIHRALYDSLTTLPRRHLLLDRLGVAMKRCARDGSSGALLFLDLHGISQINEAHGHAAGDAALRGVAARLTSLVRSSDSLARLEGCHFVVLLPKESGLLESLAIGEKLVAALREPVAVHGQEMEISASIGVARFRDATETPERLLERAREAMDATAKEARGRVRLL